jgi:hypothetical protein
MWRVLGLAIETRCLLRQLAPCEERDLHIAYLDGIISSHTRELRQRAALAEHCADLLQLGTS